MLFREDPRGLILVSQPAHAFVSGQLARAWGAPRFGLIAPRDDVCLGAEQHDVGWTDWEADPTLNPRTGRPYTFMELPLERHLEIWSGAARRVLSQSRYAALLVSGHGTGLYRRRDGSNDRPEQARRVAEFLAGETAFQNDLLAGLRADPVMAPFATDEAIRRNQRLVAVWDRLSLALCGGRREPLVVGDVPAVDGAVTLQLAPLEGAPDTVGIAPWPFAAETVTLTFEGRRLPFTFLDRTDLRTGLDRAPWVTVRVSLAPEAQRAE
jgi:hypothetical protein